MLEGKKIIVGVTGGIACYKTVELGSRLRKAGAGIDVVMTAAAEKFVSPLTFASVAGSRVYTDQFSLGGGEVTHVALAERADAIIIAPLTANSAAKLAIGMADNLLTTIVLAARSPVLLAPAMNVKMWENQIVQENLSKLQQRGYIVLDPASGFLACGASGSGRMAEPAEILQALVDIFREKDLEGYHILVTAGPTREALDPVRFLSNRSSGKMGYALAGAAVKRGAKVSLVSGPVSLDPPRGAEVVQVETAAEMYAAVLSLFPSVDIVIKTAAVADYRPVDVFPEKIKKTESRMTLELEKNPDILLELGRKKKNQILIGFAAETTGVAENAQAKLHQKNLDMVVANDVSRGDSGFNVDFNQVTLFYRDGAVEELPLRTKTEVADEILDAVRRIVGGERRG